MASPQYIQNLRLELKQWETSFAAEHGWKPSRKDIKLVPEIEAKYKEYNKLREPPPSKSTTAPAPSHSTRPKAQSQAFETPRKTKTRRGSAQRTSDLGLDSSRHEEDPFQSPSVSRSNKSNTQGSARSQRSHAPLETPTNPNRIKGSQDSPLFEYDFPLKIRRIRFGKDGETVGPTPQKTGKVLGIFESMMIEGTLHGARGSPRKQRQEITQVVSDSPSKNSNGLFETPRKRKLHQDDVEDSPSVRAASSVAGSASRSAATIVPDGETPRKRRYDQDIFATPSFLRRSTARIMDPALLSSPPVPLPQPMRPKLVKGLSGLMADLRKMQDEILEDEMDNLRELEREALSVTKKSLFADATSTIKAAVVTDNPESNKADRDQPPAESATLNVEHGSETEARDGEAKADEAPKRIWKKGLKRQTRRVKMRPVRAKPLSKLPIPGEGGDTLESSEDEADPGTHPTSLVNEAAAGSEEGSDEEDASRYSGSEAESGAEPEPIKLAEKPLGRQVAKKKTVTTVTTTETTVTTKKAAGKGKRAATTGANYCKLKIRTQGGMKGRGGGFRGRGGGRFGRRR